MHASKPHASILPLVKTKFGLQTINMLLCHSCIVHSINKHSPGGREALAVFPPDQPSLYGFLCVQWIALETCFNCAWIKFHPFQNSPTLAGSISAHILSKELEVVWTTYRDNVQDSLILTSHSLQVIQLTILTIHCLWQHIVLHAISPSHIGWWFHWETKGRYAEVIHYYWVGSVAVVACCTLITCNMLGKTLPC